MQILFAKRGKIFKPEKLKPDDKSAAPRKNARRHAPKNEKRVSNMDYMDFLGAKKKPKAVDTLEQFYNADLGSVASSTTYTGLTPTPPHSEFEANSYAMLYTYPHDDEDDEDGKNPDKKKKG